MIKAKWKGEIKIQQSLPIIKNGKFLIYNQDKSILIEFPSSKSLRVLLNNRAKAYFKATLLGDGKLNIRQEIPERDW